MTTLVSTAAGTVPLQKPPSHAIVADKTQGVFQLVNSDTGRSHIACADFGSAIKEQARLNALSAQEKF
jgi:hypothetical protein